MGYIKIRRVLDPALLKYSKIIYLCVFEIIFALHFTKVPGSAIGGLGLTGLFLQIFLNLGNDDAV